MPNPPEHDIDIYRGDDLAVGFSFRGDPAKPWSVPPVINLSAFAFAAQLRQYPDSAESTPFVIDDSKKATGLIVLRMPKTVTADLKTDGYYDLQATETATGKVTTYIRGRVRLVKDVTR